MDDSGCRHGGCTLSGCVTQSRYNTMLSQQQAIEASLRQQMAMLPASLQAEINADQVKIQQLENGIRVSMSSDLLYPSGAVAISHQGRAALTSQANHCLRGKALQEVPGLLCFVRSRSNSKYAIRASTEGSL